MLAVAKCRIWKTKYSIELTRKDESDQTVESKISGLRRGRGELISYFAGVSIGTIKADAGSLTAARKR